MRPYRSRFRGSAHQTTGFTTRRPDDFPIPLELFWDFFRGYFLFPREERKNSSDLSFESSEVSFDSSEEIFLAHVENRKYPPRRIENIHRGIPKTLVRYGLASC